MNKKNEFETIIKLENEFLCCVDEKKRAKIEKAIRDIEKIGKYNYDQNHTNEEKIKFLFTKWYEKHFDNKMKDDTENIKELLETSFKAGYSASINKS
jgi:hypothetical protein